MNLNVKLFKKKADATMCSAIQFMIDAYCIRSLKIVCVCLHKYTVYVWL